MFSTGVLSAGWELNYPLACWDLLKIVTRFALGAVKTMLLKNSPVYFLKGMFHAVSTHRVSKSHEALC